MGTVRYTVVDGEVLSELRGGVKRDYVPDPLGSTVALLDSSQNITDTFSYWPYGESAGRTGTTATPFQYVGSFGYYQDGTARNYVRARYLDKINGRWITEDLFENIYLTQFDYCFDNPINYIDKSGLTPSECCENGKSLDCKTLCRKFAKKPGSDISGIAGVICCGEKKCVCIFGLPPVIPAEGVCPGMDGCFRSHEENHKKDITCNPSKGLDRPEFTHPEQQMSRECYERNLTVACLRIKRRSASQSCKDAMGALIRFMEQWLSENCRNHR